MNQIRKRGGNDPLRKFVYNKLRGKIVERFLSQKNFAKAMDMSETTLSYRMTGAASWSQDEMVTAMDLLHIPLCEVFDYFFCEEGSQM